MDVVSTDVVIVGAGGAGLRAAESNYIGGVAGEIRRSLRQHRCCQARSC